MPRCLAGSYCSSCTKRGQIDSLQTLGRLHLVRTATNLMPGSCSFTACQRRTDSGGLGLIDGINGPRTGLASAYAQPFQTKFMCGKEFLGILCDSPAEDFAEEDSNVFNDKFVRYLKLCNGNSFGVITHRPFALMLPLTTPSRAIQDDDNAFMPALRGSTGITAFKTLSNITCMCLEANQTKVWHKPMWYIETPISIYTLRIQFDLRVNECMS